MQRWSFYSDKGNMAGGLLGLLAPSLPFGIILLLLVVSRTCTNWQSAAVGIKEDEAQTLICSRLQKVWLELFQPGPILSQDPPRFGCPPICGKTTILLQIMLWFCCCHHLFVYLMFWNMFHKPPLLGWLPVLRWQIHGAGELGRHPAIKMRKVKTKLQRKTDEKNENWEVK